VVSDEMITSFADVTHTIEELLRAYGIGTATIQPQKRVAQQTTILPAVCTPAVPEMTV
jgi:hypothetical protein